MKTTVNRLLMVLFLAFSSTVFCKMTTVMAAPDPNFWVYLCFGQSNMAGQAEISAVDYGGVSNRFKVMYTVASPDHKRWGWSTATPPLCRPSNGLCPADYFGRYMTKYLPDSISIGVINVAVEGCSIDLFEREASKTFRDSILAKGNELSWQVSIVDQYENSDPLGALIKAAKLAQNDGVIKGFLLHQGETDAYSDNWIHNLDKVYHQLLDTLSLDAKDVPLIVGEVVHSGKGGVCASANKTIDRVPQFIPNSAVVPSKGLSCMSDKLHFDTTGQRKLGRGYCETLLTLMGYDYTSVETLLEDAYTNKEGIYNLKGQKIDAPEKGINIINGKKVLVK